MRYLPILMLLFCSQYSFAQDCDTIARSLFIELSDSKRAIERYFDDLPMLTPGNFLNNTTTNIKEQQPPTTEHKKVIVGKPGYRSVPNNGTFHSDWSISFYPVKDAEKTYITGRLLAHTSPGERGCTCEVVFTDSTVFKYTIPCNFTTTMNYYIPIDGYIIDLPYREKPDTTYLHAPQGIMEKALNIPLAYIHNYCVYEADEEEDVGAGTVGYSRYTFTKEEAAQIQQSLKCVVKAKL